MASGSLSTPPSKAHLVDREVCDAHIHGRIVRRQPGLGTEMVEETIRNNCIFFKKEDLSKGKIPPQMPQFAPSHATPVRVPSL